MTRPTISLLRRDVRVESQLHRLALDLHAVQFDVALGTGDEPRFASFGQRAVLGRAGDRDVEHTLLDFRRDLGHVVPLFVLRYVVEYFAIRHSLDCSALLFSS